MPESFSYLLLVIGAFSLFALAVAYASARAPGRFEK
jgi:hypothetical protein